MSRWWSGAAGAEGVDRVTRWPLYLLSASEPPVVLLLLGGQPQVPVGGAAALLVVTVAHAVACLTLLRAGIAHFLGGPRPATRLIGLAVALTAAGVAAGVAVFPGDGGGVHGAFQLGFPAGVSALLFCAGLTAAASPLLPARRLFAAVALPAAAAGVLQVATGNSGRPVWAVNYLLFVGGVAFTYRCSVWALGVLWELDRAQEVQARLAVAEERLRFARDLHDVLGRNLTLIAVNSDLAAQLVPRNQDGALEHLLAVRQIAQDSMRELRVVVAGHRVSDLDSELAGARSLLRSAGVSARVIGDGAGLPGTAQAALGWVVREATTNIIRHSDAATAKIELDIAQGVGSERTAMLRIENDGARAPAPGSDGGAGLVGLRERLAGLGGALNTEALPGGRFLLQVRLPLDRQSSAATSPEPAP